MAKGLFILGLAFEREDLTDISTRMQAALRDLTVKHPSSFANWASVMMSNIYPFYTIAITGPGCLEKAAALRKLYHPSLFICGSEKSSALPILRDRFVEGETMVFVCTGRDCKLPTTSLEEALGFILTD
jgi:hypothetical protein